MDDFNVIINVNGHVGIRLKAKNLKDAAARGKAIADDLNIDQRCWKHVDIEEVEESIEYDVLSVSKEQV